MALSDLKCPSFLVGHLNCTSKASVMLGLSSVCGVLCLTPKGATTLKMNRGSTKGDPIDHILVNRAGKDLARSVKIGHSVKLSDHFPLVLRFQVCQPGLI